MRAKKSQIGLSSGRVFSYLMGLLALVFITSACQFDGSFEAARCSSQADCAAESVCVEGFCAQPGSSQYPNNPTPDAGSGDVSDADTTPDDAGLADIGGEDVDSGDGGADDASDTLDGSDPDTTPDPEVFEIDLSPDSLELAVGEVATVEALALDEQGDPLDELSADDFVWSSSNPSMAVVYGDGEVLALSPGVLEITARVGSVEASIPVEIVEASGDYIEIFPLSITVTAGQTAEARAFAYDVNGTVLDPSEIRWSVPDQSVATVDQTGHIETLSAGTTRVVVELRDDPAISVFSTLTVNPVVPASALLSPTSATVRVGQSVELHVFDDDLNPINASNISWQSSDDQIATVDPATGIVSAEGEGVATITATFQSIDLTSTITVEPKPVARVEIAPPFDTIKVDETIQLTATTFSADGDPLGKPVTWSVDQGASFASVDSNGLVTGDQVGLARITAEVDGVSGFAAVDVRPKDLPAVDNVAVSPQNPGDDDTINIGETIQLEAELTDASGSILTGRSVQWSSTNPTIAWVDASGQVVGRAVGNADIEATADNGESGSYEIFVEAQNHAPIAFAQTLSVAQETPISFQLNGHDPDGDTLTFDYVDPAQGSIVFDDPNSGPSTGLVTYTPPVGFVGQTQFTFSVEDPDGESDDATVTLDIEAGNMPPDANATVDPATGGTTCTDYSLKAGGSSDATTALADLDFEWTVMNKPNGSTDPVLTDATDEEATLSGTSQGVYVIKLTVTDEDGAVDSAFLVIKVGAEPSAGCL